MMNDNTSIEEFKSEYFNTEKVTENNLDVENEIKSTEIKKEKDDVKTKKPMVGIIELFRFAKKFDVFLIIIGLISACIHGAAMPLMMIVFGETSDLFVNQSYTINRINEALEKYHEYCDPLPSCNTTATPQITMTPTITIKQITLNTVILPTRFFTSQLPCFPFPCAGVDQDWIFDNIDQFLNILTSLGFTDLADQIRSLGMDAFMDQMRKNALYFTYLGCFVLVVGYLEMTCWHISAYNQCERIRSSLFKSILRQNIGWFDCHDPGELNNRLVGDVEQIERGIGDKLGLFFQYTSVFIAGFIVGFVYGWELTLVILAASPLLIIAGGIMAKVMSSMSEKELKAYAKAGSVAEEVLGSIRTVTAFSGQKKEIERYKKNLIDAQKLGVQKGIFNGVSLGIVFFVMYGTYALAFWYGSILILDRQTYTVGTMLIVLFSVLMGAFSIGAVSPNVQDFSNARGAAYAIYNIIDINPPIDSYSNDGMKPEKLIGDITFKDVIFKYPSRPDTSVINKMNFTVKCGKTVALVGSSGCGKSTIIQLLQRFYDSLEGQILIDNYDIKELNVKWLRENIGVVGQEPVLFGMTIAENIAYGRDGVTQEDIEAAAVEANAHNFISELPLRYNTLVGERGAQLSGGQKQRIAIARALVRHPIILLLDEATSALDNESESLVQDALDKASKGRTTIIIAHRLSTIQNVDIIYCLKNGEIIEQGNHILLMNQLGYYHNLYNNQKKHIKKDLVNYEKESSSSDEESSDEKNIKYEKMKSFSSESHDLLEIKEKELKPDLLRIMKMNSSEWLYIIIGCICSFIEGLIQIAFALIFANIITIYSVSDPVYKREKSNFWSLMFLLIGIIACLGHIGMGWMFAISGEALTLRFRLLAFTSYLRQEIAYFDDHLNSIGALCSRLSTDASAVKGATGSRLSNLLQSFASVGGGIVVGFIYSWQLTLVVLAFAPFMIASGFIEMKVFAGSRLERNTKFEEAARVAVEAIENIRTVASLTKETTIIEKYSSLIAVPYNSNRRKAHIVGIAFSFSQATIYFANAACFMFGAYLVSQRQLGVEEMFKVFSAIIFGAMAAGQASSFASDYGKAKMAAARLFQLFDRIPAIDSADETGNKPEKISGALTFENVQFSYPTRPNIQVLKGINLDINPGEIVALVGSSGCGKSTIIQLLERFYDPTLGKMTLDKFDTNELNINWLRSQIGLVSQEPILFDQSIRENIAYGDNSRQVTMEEIIEAAKKANIHDFIQSIPLGYETNVGDKGTQLSGGQKQRIAIARALIREPSILLLDEATSALDNESEKIVQDALEKAQSGRTSLVIAHRLTTIQNADLIVVIHNGKIVEKGTHAGLLEKKRFYYKLYNKQNRDRV